MALVREAFEDPWERSKALGIWASGGAVASAAGPLLGGTLSALDWRLIFWINVPVCLVMLVLARRVEASPHRPGRFDWLGQVLALLGLGALIVALIEGSGAGYGSPAILGLFVLAGAGLGGFVLAQTRVAHPMMPLSLFRPAPMRIAMFGGFVFILTWFGTVFLASLFLQQQLGLSSAVAGLCFLPSAVVSFFGNVASGHLANRFGTRFPTVLGLTSMTLGLIGLIIAANGDSALAITLLVVLVGAGGSVATPPFAGVVLSHAAPGQAGIASASANMFRQVGGALAVAVFGALIAGGWGFVTGMQVALAGAAVLCLRLDRAVEDAPAPRP
jgi:DHA2 family methylenomycin A resistance protein-like MFS transporter